MGVNPFLKIHNLVIIIHELSILEFTNLLKFICNPKINIAPLWSFTDVARTVNSLSCLTYVFPAEIHQGNTLPSGFIPKKKPFSFPYLSLFE